MNKTFIQIMQSTRILHVECARRDLMIITAIRSDLGRFSIDIMANIRDWPEDGNLD